MTSPHALAFLVRDLEECDRSGLVVSPEMRERAGAAAGVYASGGGDRRRELTESERAFVLRRSEALVGTLGARAEFLRRLARQTGMPGWTMIVLPLLALLLGLLTNEFGFRAIASTSYFHCRSSGSSPGMRPSTCGLRFAACAPPGRPRRRRGIRWPSRSCNGSTPGWMPRPAEARAETLTVWACVGRRWAQRWARVGKCQLLVAFHFSATVFAVGLVGGMYLRGLDTEYRARWESPFSQRSHGTSGAGRGARAGRVDLGPAIADGATQFAALRAARKMPRGGFIYAITAGIWIIGPRGPGRRRPCGGCGKDSPCCERAISCRH